MRKIRREKEEKKEIESSSRSSRPGERRGFTAAPICLHPRRWVGGGRGEERQGLNDADAVAVAGGGGGYSGKGEI